MNRVLCYGPAVIAAWGGVNALLVFTLLIYGETLFATSLYAAVVVLIELIATVAVWYMTTHGDVSEGAVMLPRRSAAPLMIVVMGAFVGAGFVYKPWMMTPAALLVIPLVLDMSASFREHRNARLAQRATPVPLVEPEVHVNARKTIFSAVAGAAVGYVAARRRTTRRGRS